MTDTNQTGSDLSTPVSPTQQWLSRCCAAVAAGSTEALHAELLDEESQLCEVLYEGTQIRWADHDSAAAAFGVDPRDLTTPEMAAATVVADLAAALVGEHSSEGAVSKALTHFEVSGVRSTGGQLLDRGSPLVQGGDALAVMMLSLVGAVDHPSRGFVMLLLCELAGRRAASERAITVPVLLVTADHHGTRGQAGRLTLTILADGPSGLHPDPATMSFLQAAPDAVTGLETAWATSSLASTGACVVWSVTLDKDAPCLSIEGPSMSAAFAVGLDDVARSGFRRLRRLRTLDPLCAVTAGLLGSTLTEVSGYAEKTRIARAHNYRVVVAQSALDAAKVAAPPEWVIKISGAATVDDAVTATRTRVNKALLALAAAIVVLLLIVAGGSLIGYTKITAANRRALSTQLAAAATDQVNSNSRIAALLALTADRIHSSDTTRAAIRDVADNNESVVASASAGDGAIASVAAYDGIAMSAVTASSVVKAWTLPALTPLGELDLGSRIRGMDGGGYAGSGLIAVLAGSTLKIFQGKKGTMPSQVASYPTPFTDGSRTVFGPVVDASSNAIFAVDDRGQGIFWTPGMSAPDTFSLTDAVSGSSTIVAVSPFGKRHDTELPERQRVDTAGSTVLLATSNGAVRELRITGTAPPVTGVPSAQTAGVAHRTYSTVPAVNSTLDSPIYSLAIARRGSILVGTDTGLRQFDRNTTGDSSTGDAEPDVDRVVKERVTAILALNLFSNDLAYVTNNGLGYITASHATPLTNIDQNTAVRRAIMSATSTTSGVIVTGRTDGRMVVFDPSNTLTRLRDRWGATDITFGSGDQLVRASVQGTGSNFFSSVAVGGVSRTAESELRLQQSTDSEDLPAIDETYYELADNDRPVQVFAVDATDNTAAATGIDRSTGRAYVWIWDRHAGTGSSGHTEPSHTLTFEGSTPGSQTVDIGYGLALSPDGSRVYAYNAGRGQMAAWSTSSGRLLWATNIPVAVDKRAALGAHVSFDRARRLAIVDRWKSDGKIVHTAFDLATGAATELPGLSAYQETFLSPAGDTLAATADNDITVLRYRFGATAIEKLSGPTDLGSIVGSVAWNPASNRLAVDVFGTGQVAFFSTNPLHEDGPRWRLSDLGTNDNVTGIAWSPSGDYLAINVGHNERDANYRSGAVRVMLTDSSNMTVALCRIAGSDWTDEEWRRYVGDHDRLHVC